MEADHLLVLCSCPDESSAAAIATALLEERLAACVNRVRGVRSAFWWQGRIERDDELLLLAKTTGRRFRELEAAIRRLHPYENPEIIGLPITHGSDAYLQWLDSETQ